MKREERRYQLMLVQMDDQLLRLKHLDKLGELLSHQLVEMQDLRAWHLEPKALPPGPTMAEISSELV